MQVTDRRTDAEPEGRKYVIWVQSCLEPSGQRRTINRQIEIMAQTPSDAAARALTAALEQMQKEKQSAIPGTRYQILITETESGADWTMNVSYKGGPTKPERPRQATYKERARMERGDLKTANAADEPSALTEYMVEVVSQQSGSGQPVPLRESTTVMAATAIQAAEETVESLRKRMPGLISAGKGQTTYQVEVVWRETEKSEYQGWAIEVVCDRGRHVAETRPAPTVH